MTTNPNQFTNQEWVAYNTHWISVIQLVVFGLILIILGFSWGMSGLSTLFVETSEGVMIVEGGASNGTFKGPFMASIGIMLLTYSQYPYHQAKQIKEWVEP